MARVVDIKNNRGFASIIPLGHSLPQRQVYWPGTSMISKEGVLGYLGIPYANLVTGSGDGMDVDLIRLFARYLGVKYQFVPKQLPVH